MVQAIDAKLPPLGGPEAPQMPSTASCPTPPPRRGNALLEDQFAPTIYFNFYEKNENNMEKTKKNVSKK